MVACSLVELLDLFARVILKFVVVNGNSDLLMLGHSKISECLGKYVELFFHVKIELRSYVPEMRKY